MGEGWRQWRDQRRAVLSGTAEDGLEEGRISVDAERRSALEAPGHRQERIMARRKGKSESFEGPKLLERKRLERLPQTFDVWQVAARPVGATVQAGSRAVRPWMIVVVS